MLPTSLLNSSLESSVVTSVAQPVLPAEMEAFSSYLPQNYNNSSTRSTRNSLPIEPQIFFRSQEISSLMPVSSPSSDDPISPLSPGQSPHDTDSSENLSSISSFTLTPGLVPLQQPLNLLNFQALGFNGQVDGKKLGTDFDGDIVESTGLGPATHAAVVAAATPLGITPGTIQELLQEQDLKKKRLARKAELARLSRRKKKVRMVDLEDEVAKYKAELDRLKEENKRLMQEQATTSVSNKKRKKSRQEEPQPAPSVESAVDAILSLRGESLDNRAATLIHEVGQAFQSQASAIDVYLKSLEKYVTPCLPIQFLDWVFSKGDKFYEDENGLFLSLFRDEMGATPEQIMKLMEIKDKNRDRTSSDKGKEQVLTESFRLLERLVRQRGSAAHAETFQKLRTIFTPAQLVTYFRWVAKFGPVCVKINI